jgi:hypothetical protein
MATGKSGWDLSRACQKSLLKGSKAELTAKGAAETMLTIVNMIFFVNLDFWFRLSKLGLFGAIAISFADKNKAGEYGILTSGYFQIITEAIPFS